MTAMTPPSPPANHSLASSLAIPADLRFLDLAQDYVRRLAKLADFSPEEGLALELAAEEAFMNIIEHAYPGQRPGQVFWEGELTTSEFTLSIRDEGLPFEASLDPDDRPKAPGGEERGRGLGLRLIRHAVDEARFENLGRQGKVLRLSKRLNRPAPAVPEPPAARLAPAPPQRYTVRAMRSEDAIQVARIFWLVYGYSYKSDSLYRPEELLRLVESGRAVSLVAVGEDGQVAGHAGLLRPEPVPMAEAAFLAVSPAHRGRGLMTMLGDAVKVKAGELGLRGLAMCPVTSHAISQKQAQEFGERPCGLELAAASPVLFKQIAAEDAPPQRESILHCFMYLAPPPAVTCHVPPRHRAMVARIYANLGQACALGEPAPAATPGAYRVDFDNSSKKGVIKVTCADERQWPELARAARDLTEFGGAEVVYLDLPLAQPATALLAPRAEEAGFFFAGVWPCEARDGDNLRLQRLAVPFDFSRLRLHSQLGQELAAYLAAQYATARDKPRA